LPPGRGDVIKRTTRQNTGALSESALTEALCRALIIKKEVNPDRFAEGAGEVSVTCPRDCHACCSEEVVLDLTSVESLMIYLLNRDVVHLIDEYTAGHEPTGYCRFMIMDKCIINAYKPSACQMFMPSEHHGKAVCFYLAEDGADDRYADCTACSAHSNSYAVHGCMLLVQQEVDDSLHGRCFRNVYEGTRWWRKHYADLPASTRNCLDSIINDDAAGLRRVREFPFDEVLAAGNRAYNQAVQRHETDLHG
jgi:Fe-S-cluster containining protein